MTKRLSISPPLRRLLILLLLGPSFFLLSCGASDPYVEDTRVNPRQLDSQSSKNKKDNSQLAQKEKKKKSRKGTLQPRKKPSPLFEWMVKVSEPYVSKGIIKECPLRYKHFLEVMMANLSSEVKAERLVAVLNRVVFSEGDMSYVPLNKRNNPQMSLFLPYVMMGKESSKICLIYLAHSLVYSLGGKALLAKTPDSEPLLILSTPKTSLYMRVTKNFTLHTRKGLLERYPFLKEREHKYFRPLSARQLKSLFHYHLGKVALWKKEKELAQKSIRMAYKLDPQSGETQKAYGTLLASRKGTLQKGEALLEEAREKRPWDGEILEILGNVYYVKREYKRARSLYRQALKVNQNPSLRLSLARVEFQLKNHKKTLALLNEILEGKADEELRLKALILRGNIRLEEKKTQGGLKDLKKALSLRQDLPEVWGTLGEHYLEEKEYLKAKYAYQQYLSFEKNRKYRLQAVNKLQLINQLLENKKNLDPDELEKSLKASDATVRKDAINTIYKANYPRSKKVRLFKKALSDKSSEVRLLAVRYLMETSSRALSEILPLLKDSDYKVRGEVLFALKNHGNYRHLPRIVKYLSDKKSYVRDAAFQALQEISGEMNDYGYDPLKAPEKQKEAIAKWKALVKKSNS